LDQKKKRWGAKSWKLGRDVESKREKKRAGALEAGQEGRERFRRKSKEAARNEEVVWEDKGRIGEEKEL